MLTRRQRRREGGQALVEFALVANILAVLVLAIYQFGIVFAHFIDVTDAARAAARKAAEYGGHTTYDASWEATGKTQAQAAGFSSASVPGMAVSVAASPNWVAGNDVAATVTAPYTISILGVTVVSGSLSKTVTMRLEHH